MTESVEPRSQLSYGWSVGESGWGDPMNANLLRIGRFGFHPSVKSRALTAPPGSPANGDAYIPAAGATGAWAGHAGEVAIYDGGWIFAAPRSGWTVRVDDESGLVCHDGAAWSAAVLRADRLATAWAHSQATGNAHSATPAQIGALAVSNPTYTGNLYGPGSVIWRASAAEHFFSLYGLATEFGLRDLEDNGSTLNYPFVVKRGAAGEVQIGYSGGLRPVRIGGAVRNDALAGAGSRPLVALADGTFDDQDAAVFLGTIGALAADNPDFTGALKQGGTTRITSGGGAWLASVQSANLVGAGDRPVAADLTGTLQPKTPDQFRNMIFALASSLKGAANGVAELMADGRVPTAQLPSAALLALGADSTTAHRGDHGTTAYTHSQIATGNPHGTTAADVGAMATADPVFTGALKQGGTTRIASGGGADFASLRVSNLSSGFNGVLTSDYVGAVGVRGAADFRDNYIQAAASDHNHFSKLDVSASTTIGSIDATAIKVTAAGVTLTLSGGSNGQGWDVIGPSDSVDFSVPSGVTLYRYNGTTVGPATYAPGGGRAMRIVRVDASTWIMPNLS